ncbi:MAG: winged helix-turn-helix transcriptional regulator [Flavobacteriales bacterium]|nr:winged helix-turn-helix transcriptional regulator [Flavobacteriales bacterium]
MSASTDELARVLPIMFRSVVRLMAVDLDATDTGLRLPQFGILDFLLTNSEAVQTDLANHFAKDKSAMLRQLDEMEKVGWIERQMDPNDRRRKNLVVTKSGLETYKKVSKIRARVFARVLEGVSEKDVSTCLAVLNTMNDKANSGDAK